MSWMASNNAPLLGGQAVVDTSGFADQFRDGQKLRQEYEGRQQQKALNELSQEGDFNARLGKARAHKYAGALVPLIQKQEQDRLIAEQTYNQGQADIGETKAKTGKLNQEIGEIGVKTMGQTIKNMTDKYSQISAGALTQNPQYFALMLGDFQNAELINPEQKGAIIDMMMKDPASAAKVMQQLARGTIEGFKATAPEAKVLDGKDAAYMYSVNPYTGEANEPTAKINYGVSATDQMKDDTSRANNQYTVDAGERNSERSLQGTQYVADTNYAGKVYGVDSAAQTASNAQAIAWYNSENKANTDAVNAETNRIKANKAEAVAGGVDANGKPVARKLEANERSKIFELQEQIDADVGVGESLNRLSSLVEQSYSGAGAGFRGTAMSRLPFADKTRANATVVSENIAIELALKQLKSTFGAAPTEGERKILMDLQASVDKSPEQKQKIIAAALRASAARVRYRKKQQEAIRTGSYAMPKGNNSSSSSAKPVQSSKSASIIEAAMRGS